MLKVLLILLVSTCIIHAQAEVIGNEECSHRTPDGRNVLSEVHEIRITPCPEAAVSEPCVVTKGTNAILEVDFTPDVNATKLAASMFWTSTVDMVFKGIKANACEDTTCPVRADIRHTYKTTIHLGRDLPVGTYPVKLKLSSASHKKNVIVCQNFKIKLVAPSVERSEKVGNASMEASTQAAPSGDQSSVLTPELGGSSYSFTTPDSWMALIIGVVGAIGLVVALGFICWRKNHRGAPFHTPQAVEVVQSVGDDAKNTN